MANAVPVNKPTPAPKKIVPVPVSDELSLEDQIAALKAQLEDAAETNAALIEGGNNAGRVSIVKNKTTLPDGTVKVDY